MAELEIDFVAHTDALSAATQEAPVLEARGLHKRYAAGSGQISAVVDIRLQVKAGEFVAICGRSGSGKSTLLGMLGGLCRPSQGSVIQYGTELWSRAAGDMAEFRNRRIGFVFQFASLLPTLRAIDNVALPALIGGTGDTPAAYARAESLLRQVGLSHRLNSYPRELSGGEQRRVALARALMNQPQLLLADEPTSDLDPQTEVEIFELLLELQREHQLTLLVVTHNPEIAAQANRILSLQRGRLVSTEHAARIIPPPEKTRFVSHDVGDAASARREQVIESAESPSKAVPLGSGFGSFLLGFVGWVALFVVGLLALNYGVTAVQHRLLVDRQLARHRVEDVAFKQLRADIENLAYRSDGTCELTLYLENNDPDRELFVLFPTVSIFIQVGRHWQEISSKPVDGEEGGVIRLTGRQRLSFVFRPEVEVFEEQIAGYMHVRVANVFVVSASSQPKDDLVERADAYYVYLKPHDADDAEILRRNNWSGKPPLWIPMPPH